MSRVRVLVGTKKGAFILTADGKRQNWEVSGPHFAGWEMYHLKGSPADNRMSPNARRHPMGVAPLRGRCAMQELSGFSRECEAQELVKLWPGHPASSQAAWKLIS